MKRRQFIYHSGNFKIIKLASLFLTISIFSYKAEAQTIPPDIKAELTSPFFEKLYANTYYSLLQRLGKDGFLPESLTGAYEGMYCRTTGALVPLLLETARLNESERIINCVLTAMDQFKMDRVPHVIGVRDKKFYIISDEPQVDGQAHLIMAWAMLALKRGHTSFEDRTWPMVSELMKRTCDRTYLQHGRWSVETGLVRNISFEHSREGRRWDTWDLLTQSFVGAALKYMVQVAARRGNILLREDWRKKLQQLTEGIRRNLTTVSNGDTTYLEMRLPDGNGGKPFFGMGWVTLSPIASQWEALDHVVMRNTVKKMQQTMIKTTNDITWMPTDSYEDGTVANEIIGKGIAWEMDFARTEKDYNRIRQLFALIKTVNAAQPVYMEGGWLDVGGHKQSEKLSDRDLMNMKDALWKIKDAGNGEQTAWWCWAMARLRKEAGLPAEPQH
jgi:hypothetical protein